MSDRLSSELKYDHPEPRTIDEFLDQIRSQYCKEDLKRIEKAYHYSETAHEGQIRRSGEPYISHPLCVSSILSELNLDAPTIMTGLLHDTVEDTAVTLKNIEEEFGSDIRLLVDGVTKISQISFRNTHAKQGENIRKMIVAMGKDIRVIVVKLADRLHNMRTLNHMPYEKQARIAQETLDIYAPIANRLGISAWKVELEDLSFRYLKPDIFYELAQKVSKKKKEREKYIDEVRKILNSEMGKRAKIKPIIQGRPKHLYSIYRKMTQKNIDYDEVYDVLAFRVIVESMAQCYEVLGVVHSLYRPIPGRFKDYIAMAKANNYQSLHTTVIGPDGERIEIQIRTHEMHLVAERGIAAHWAYKEGGRADDKSAMRFEWLKNLMDWHRETGDSDEFLENVKSDLFESEIYVFTPNGDVKELPEGSTPLDFSYSIHTDVGNRTVGAKIDGRIVPLKHKLKNGDTVDIMTSPHQKPSKDWLKYCVTTRAKSKIRAFIRSEERKRSVALGTELLEKEFRKHGYKLESFVDTDHTNKFLESIGAKGIEELYAQVAYGKQMPLKAVERMVPDFRKEEDKPKEEDNSSFLGRMFKSNKKRKGTSLIKVDGMSDLLVHYAKCCNPIPGDPIVGFISRGRGVTIHQAACPKTFEIDPGRRVDVEWAGSEHAQERHTKIRVVCHDIPGLLKLMSDAFTANGVNIHNAQIKTNNDRKAICVFDVVVKDTSQLTRTIQSLEKIKGVIRAERMHYS